MKHPNPFSTLTLSIKILSMAHFGTYARMLILVGLLIVYFLSAAISIPIWRRLITKFGNKKIWCLAIIMSIVFFAFVLLLDKGQFLLFLLICIMTGIALGGELICPPSVLNNLIPYKNEGVTEASTYFGIWNLTNKIALAIASGFCLPLLSLLGYDPNLLTAEGIVSLMFMYAGAPCIIKLICLYLMASFIRAKDE